MLGQASFMRETSFSRTVFVKGLGSEVSGLDPLLAVGQILAPSELVNTALRRPWELQVCTHAPAVMSPPEAPSWPAEAPSLGAVGSCGSPGRGGDTLLPLGSPLSEHGWATSGPLSLGRVRVNPDYLSSRERQGSGCA